MILFVDNISDAVPTISSSHSELPISYPAAFKNVFAIPPPTITFCDLSNRFLMTSSLVETFAPPTTLTKLPLCSSAELIFNTSFANNSPAHDCSDLRIAP